MAFIIDNNGLSGYLTGIPLPRFNGAETFTVAPADWKMVEKYSLINTITLAALLLISSAAFGAAPVESFASLPKFSSPKISPDGTRIASTITYRGKPLLVVQKLDMSSDDPAEDMTPINAGENFFNWYEWGNNERLIFNIRGSFKMFGGLWNLSQMGSINRNGKDARQFKMTPNRSGMYRQNTSIINLLKDDDQHILAALDDDQNRWAAPEVHRVNIVSGERKRVLKNKIGAQNWIADSRGLIKIGVKNDTKDNRLGVTIYYRDNERSDWEELQTLNYFDQDRLIPLRFETENDNILLVARGNISASDESELNLLRYDLTTRKILGPYEDSYRRNILGIVERALPDTTVKIVSHSKDKKKYTFRAYTDIQAPEYYLLDLNKNSLKFIAEEYPDLRNSKLSKMEEVNYSARDGLNIPAFLTIPNGSGRKNLPVIVYPHGGPWARDNWGFDNYVQFFASRGYAVFQPQFRGSTGQGIAHQEAGYGQWGYAIQDDITDGVLWLIDQQIADPNRICIVGSSFGGYAAAMGVAKTPDLFRCGVSVNGVLDFKKFLRSQRRLLFSAINIAITKGENDASAASPYHMAKNITSPLLLIASERDTIVPAGQSIAMYKRMKKLKKPVTYIELAGGEHWRTIEANEIKKLTAIEKFLAEHLDPVEKEIPAKHNEQSLNNSASLHTKEAL